jgi:hypothetical protein
MAKNFKISVQRNNNTLGIELIGDFDGTSACELLNVLQDNCRDHVRVVVNTARVKEVYPFGVDTFNNNLYLLKNRHIRLEFTGNRSSTIAPRRNTLF